MLRFVCSREASEVLIDRDGHDRGVADVNHDATVHGERGNDAVVLGLRPPAFLVFHN